MSARNDETGRRRVVITAVAPEIDGGRFPIRRVVGDAVVVEADAFADGRDALTCRMLVRPANARSWSEAPMKLLSGDRWRASFTAGEVGRWHYSVTAWVDRFKTWRRDLRMKVDAGQDVTADLFHGAVLIRDAVRRAEGDQSAGPKRNDARILAALAADLDAGTDPSARLRLALDDELALLMDRHTDRRFATVYHALEVVVDRERARFSSWCATAQIEDAAAMGFDVVVPPTPAAAPVPPPPPGAEVAAPLDGPAADFDSEGWRAAWDAQKAAVDRLLAQGVRLFTVENPDARPFAFWEWLIGTVQREHPDALFLAVASARPTVMDRLARLGFSWLHRELRDPYLREAKDLALAQRDLWRPLLWVHPGGADFHLRLVLAATLGTSFGVSCGEDGSMDDARELLTRLNQIRRENPALHSDRGLRFHATDNERVLCFSKVDDKGSNALLAAVNLDPQEAQSAWLELPVAELGLPRDQPYPVYDLLQGARYLWHGARSFVQLDSQPVPALLFRLRGRRMI